ncbi:MAG: hypothetical protein KTR35_14675 [Gammaproteobacteria bacterium]|nr:hypothetical protein [Gammaproteobacteria bacterium]
MSQVIAVEEDSVMIFSVEDLSPSFNGRGELSLPDVPAVAKMNESLRVFIAAELESIETIQWVRVGRLWRDYFARRHFVAQLKQDYPNSRIVYLRFPVTKARFIINTVSLPDSIQQWLENYSRIGRISTVNSYSESISSELYRSFGRQSALCVDTLEFDQGSELRLVFASAGEATFVSSRRVVTGQEAQAVLDAIEYLQAEGLVDEGVPVLLRGDNWLTEQRQILSTGSAVAKLMVHGPETDIQIPLEVQRWTGMINVLKSATRLSFTKWRCFGRIAVLASHQWSFSDAQKQAVSLRWVAVANALSLGIAVMMVIVTASIAVEAFAQRSKRQETLKHLNDSIQTHKQSALSIHPQASMLVDSLNSLESLQAEPPAAFESWYQGVLDIYKEFSNLELQRLSFSKGGHLDDTVSYRDLDLERPIPEHLNVVLSGVVSGDLSARKQQGQIVEFVNRLRAASFVRSADLLVAPTDDLFLNDSSAGAYSVFMVLQDEMSAQN